LGVDSTSPEQRPLGNEQPPFEGEPEPEAPFGPGSSATAGVVAVCLCGIIAFLGLYATQPLLPMFVRIFHASKAAVGLTVSASTLGVAIGAPLFGLFAERLSRRRVIVCSAIAVAVPTLMAATSQSLHALILWRFLQGLATPGVFAITVTYVTEEWPSRSVAFVMSVYVSGTALGGFIGRITAGLAASRLGWRYSFILLGLGTFAGAAAIARWLPAGSAREAAQPGSHMGGAFHPMLAHLRNPRLIATYAVGFNVLFSLVGVFTYITFYLSDAPFHLSTVALSYLFVVYLIGLLATPAAGYMIGSIGLRRGIASAILLTLAGVVVTLIHALPIVILGLAMVCTGVFIAQTTAYSFLRDAVPPGGRVSAVGLYVSCYYLGGTAAGVIPGYVWHLGGWPACVVLIALLQLLTLTLALTGWRLPVTATDFPEPTLPAALR
jgi:MFS transporter, YNFM family, putative membrane transport protein